MVLVNTLTVEAINTALIALQRGQSIVVGGEKPSTTVNNITISNGGGGSGGSGLDFTPQINALDKRVGLLEKAEEVLRLENERQNERLEALEGLGITDFYFDDTSRELTIELANGEVFDTEVTSESFSMEVVNGELIIRIGEQVHTVTLPMGSQADWTQTDPDDPSFIKHKIPIWITQGSADDNMSPIDSVTDGSMRPVTSNAVYDKHYLTSADITNQVTVDNMQSVSSNAVAIALTSSKVKFMPVFKQYTAPINTDVRITDVPTTSDLPTGSEIIVYIPISVRPMQAWAQCPVQFYVNQNHNGWIIRSLGTYSGDFEVQWAVFYI